MRRSCLSNRGQVALGQLDLHFALEHAEQDLDAIARGHARVYSHTINQWAAQHAHALAVAKACQRQNNDAVFILLVAFAPPLPAVVVGRGIGRLLCR
jgi:hypothetical protein